MCAELNEEIQKALVYMKRLDPPSPPRAILLDPCTLSIEWEHSETKSGLEITYKLFDGNYDVINNIGDSAKLPLCHVKMK